MTSGHSGETLHAPDREGHHQNLQFDGSLAAAVTTGGREGLRFNRQSTGELERHLLIRRERLAVAGHRVEAFPDRGRSRRPVST